MHYLESEELHWKTTPGRDDIMENGETGEEPDEGHADRFLRHPRDFGSQIHPSGPDCQHSLLLWRSEANKGGQSEDTTWPVAQRELCAAARQCTSTHCAANERVSRTDQHLRRSTPALVARSDSCWLLSRLPNEIQAEGPPFWHRWGDPAIIAGGVEHAPRTRLSAGLPTVAEALGAVDNCAMELFRRGWWLYTDQVRNSIFIRNVSELFDGTSYMYALYGCLCKIHGAGTR